MKAVGMRRTALWLFLLCGLIGMGGPVARAQFSPTLKPIGTSTPTPTPKLAIPTFSIPTALPTIAVPTIAAPFDLAAVAGGVTTTAVVYSAGMDTIDGTYLVQVTSAFASAIPASAKFELIDSTGAAVMSWSDSITLSDASGLTTYIQPNTFSLPISASNRLPVAAYQMRITVSLDEAALTASGTAFTPDANPANNIVTTAAQTLLQTSGVLRFSNIATEITSLSSYTTPPLTINGDGSWNDLIPFTISGLIVTRNSTTLDLTVVNGGAAFSAPSTPYSPTGVWSFIYKGGQLEPGGAFADLYVELPDGVAYKQESSSAISFKQDAFMLGRQKLAQDLTPFSTTINIPTAFRWMDEELPFTLQCSKQIFSVTAGLELANATPVYQYKPHFNAPYGPGTRASNDGYFNSGLIASTTPAVTASGIQAALTGGGGSYQASYPTASTVSSASRTIQIKDGVIDPAASRLNGVTITMTVNESGCGAGSDVSYSLAFSQSAVVTSNGGVEADSALNAAISPAFNTYAFDPVSAAVWYSPGVLTGASTSLADEPSEFLQAMSARGGETLYSYGDAEFSAGSGLFAGMNLMQDELTGTSFTVSIGGDSIDLINTEYTKLYARRGGFSGVVHAQNSAQSLNIYPDAECGGDGYAITLSAFGQAYLDNDSDGLDSTTDGEIEVPWPSEITVPFEGMTLNACGNLSDGDIPAEAKEETQTLAYWLADVRLLTLAFDLKDGAASDDDRTLWISTKNTISHLGDEPVMQINLRPCGTIAESRIEAPLVSTYDDFPATVQTIYLSAYDGGSDANGFYSLISDLNVSYFNPPHVQSIVKSTVGRVASGDAWFASSGEADSDGDGFEDGYSGSFSDIADKIDDYADSNRVNVEALFANLITLRYELEYNTTKKEFKSTEPIGQDLIVLDIISSVDYLDAERTEVSFGIDVSGIPELSLSSAADQFSDQIEETFLGPVRDKLDDAAETLNQSLSAALRPKLEELIEPYVADLLDRMQTELGQYPDPADAENWLLTHADFDAMLNDLINDIGLTSYLRNAGMPAVEVIDELLDALDEIETVLRFSPEDLSPVVQDVLDYTLALVDLTLGYDLDEVLAPIEDTRDEIIAYLDDEIEPLLQDARTAFQNPTVYLADVFDLAGINTLESDVKDLIREIFANEAIEDYERLKNLQPDEVTDYIVDAILNSDMMNELDSRVMQALQPIKDGLVDAAQSVLDGVNDAVMDFIKEQADVLDGALADLNDVLDFGGGSLKGYAVFAGDALEKLHIDGEWTTKVPDEMTYTAYLDMTRYQVSNSGEGCFGSLDADDVVDTRIGTTDVSIGFAGADLTAKKIEVALMISGGQLVNVGGTIETEGSIGFETMEISDPSFGVGVGQVENYIWARAKVSFDAYQLEGGIFLGTCCSLDPLEIIDPEAASLLSITEMRGVYLSAEGSFPIYNVGCGFRVAAEAGIAMWYFADGPTYGGRLSAGAYGEAACVVSVKGSLTLTGGKEGDAYYFKGDAWVAGGVGDCEPEDWDSPSDVLDDKWCYACVADINLTYKNDDWSVDYDVDCG
ncbi:MAG: hypothetical protein GC154_15065 [bacterium]|nr:hypothetical protein [bacterium]